MHGESTSHTKLNANHGKTLKSSKLVMCETSSFKGDRGSKPKIGEENIAELVEPSKIGDFFGVRIKKTNVVKILQPLKQTPKINITT